MKRNELDLFLTFRWFDLIDSGVKTVEYRRKPYWTSRVNDWIFRNSNPVVVFHRGYTNNIIRFRVKKVIDNFWKTDLMIILGEKL